jgi:hypothetical protein
MTVVPKNRAVWFVLQLGLLLLAVLITLLIVSVVGRLILPHLGVPVAPGEYGIILSIGAVASLIMLVARREYWFVNRFEFTADRMVVGTLLGVERIYPTKDYAFVPVLHKTINWPQNKANLSFHVRRLDTGKNVRNFSWFGFGREDFVKASRLYGYDGNADFNVFDI